MVTTIQHSHRCRIRKTYKLSFIKRISNRIKLKHIIRWRTTLKFGNGEWYGKKDTILAYNDENNNYKPLPFDFSRGSSATVVNKDGLIETVGSGEPRVDYKDNTKGALLLEPSRTNLVNYSSNFQSGWSVN